MSTPIKLMYGALPVSAMILLRRERVVEGFFKGRTSLPTTIVWGLEAAPPDIAAKMVAAFAKVYGSTLRMTAPLKRPPRGWFSN
jgi:hypothetical protein